MVVSAEDRQALERLEQRLRQILPPEYQDSYQNMEPVPMKSAGLKYDGDGRVAWDEIWGSFCDLAMAGGPPHKGLLLAPGSRAEIEAQPERYRAVADEICRAVPIVCDLLARPSAHPGWIDVSCFNEAMAGWLVRAITMENVAVRQEGKTLGLPAGPAFRVEKEIKNVVTVIAKTCHYWLGHMGRAQQQAIARLFAEMNAESPLVRPEWSDDGRPDGSHPLSQRIAASVEQRTGLRAARQRYTDWLGLECSTVRAAIWMMRNLVGCNVLSRREETVLFVPVNPALDPEGGLVVEAVCRVHRLAVGREVL